MAYLRKDSYFHQAKADQYVARSVYKLKTIDERHRILRPGMRVLDLGAAPGSWSQYASERVGPSGQVVGVDLVAIPLTLPNVQFIIGDLRRSSPPSPLEGLNPIFDVVLSDMAPRTTGIRFTDQERSAELSRLAVTLLRSHLRCGGNFVCKLFQGPQFTPFRQELRAQFGSVHIERPPSVRKESKEIYFLGMNYLPVEALVPLGI